MGAQGPADATLHTVHVVAHLIRFEAHTRERRSAQPMSIGFADDAHPTKVPTTTLQAAARFVSDSPGSKVRLVHDVWT